MTLFGKSIVGIFIATVIGGGLYTVISFMKEDTTIVSSGEATSSLFVDEQATNEEPKKSITVTDKDMTFKELVTQDGSFVCTTSDVKGALSSSGTLYVDHGKIAGTFVVSVAQATVTTNILVSGGYMYTWKKEENGTLLPISKTKKGVHGTTASSTTRTWSEEDVTSYRCEEKEIEKSMFDIPSGLVFATSTNP